MNYSRSILISFIHKSGGEKRKPPILPISFRKDLVKSLKDSNKKQTNRISLLKKKKRKKNSLKDLAALCISGEEHSGNQVA